MRKLLIGLFVVALASGGLALSMYATRPSDAAEGRGERPPAPLVDVARVERRPIQDWVRLKATIEPLEQVDILSKVSGILTAIHVDLGDKVEVGQPIAEIEPEEFERRLGQARANHQLALAELKKVQVNHEAKQRDLQRTDASKREGLISEQSFDVVRAEHDSAQADLGIASAEVARAKAALEEAEINLKNTRIVAPSTGIIDQRSVDAGTLVSSSAVLCRIIKADAVRVRVAVPESRIELAQVGREAKVRVPSVSVEATGNVERVSPTVNPATQTSQVELNVANPDGKLRPGMSADVEFVINEKPDALVVPAEAVQRTNGSSHVMRVIDGKVASIAVVAGIATDGFVEIQEGLNEGDIVVVRGQFMLQDGDEARYAPV